MIPLTPQEFIYSGLQQCQYGSEINDGIILREKFTEFIKYYHFVIICGILTKI